MEQKLLKTDFQLTGKSPFGKCSKEHFWPVLDLLSLLNNHVHDGPRSFTNSQLCEPLSRGGVNRKTKLTEKI